MDHNEENEPKILDVTKEVRAFYEKYPYPRPVESLDKYRRRWKDQQRRRADFYLFWPARPYREDRSILIAGCGTSQAAKHALRWPEAQVVGIDFSATSVRFTEELKRKYKLNNLQVRHLPIEGINEMGMSFDQIVCTGVLHHLADPDAGLKALRGVLKPNGAMHLMVYAPYGRTGIYMLQEFARRIGIQAVDEDIHDLVAALRALPPGHPLENLLREAPDFQQEAALADALLNPQDRAYSVPQLFELIDQAGLTFGRWVRQAPYSHHCGVLANLPQASRIAGLPSEEQYAVAELFRGTMLRHSLILYRNDYPNLRRVDFSSDTWPGYVPIRLADTICVQKRLPPGAAAVLINQTHTYRDLFMPIDAIEKRLFDNINSVRSIRELVNRSAPKGNKEQILDRAQAFFNRLWWYDQVVFDMKGAPDNEPDIALME